MKKNCFLTLIVLPFLIEAQTKQGLEGIEFEDNLSWQQIKLKAKVERKYILVDVYASWCGPCKAMDKDIYPSEKIGKFVNEYFVSVKVQTDTTKNDNERIKNWYSDAHKIQQEYKVQAFPSLLFFSPDGEIIHRGVGYKKVDEFLEFVKSALIPKEQYYSQIKKYKQGIKDFAVMKNLITTAKDIGDNDIANL